MSSNKPLGLVALLMLSSILLNSVSAQEALLRAPESSLYEQVISGNFLDKALAWTPQIDGKIRYQFEIPIEGLRQAAKYQDAGPLFYLSAAHDEGLKFSDQNIVSLAAAPALLTLKWLRPTANETIQYSIGFSYSDELKQSSQTSVSLGYTKILEQEVLLTMRLEAGGTAHTKAAFGTTFLNAAESAQYSGWFEQGLGNSKYYELGAKSMIFEAWGVIDSSATVSHSNKGLSIGTAIYRDIGRVKSSVGLEWSERSSGLGVFVGVAFNQKTKNGNILKLHGQSTSRKTAPNWLGDLKLMHRAELMAQWREGMGFPRNK